MSQHIFLTNEESFQLRDWGGYLCFLATGESAGSKCFAVTAVVRMDQLIHDPHVHDDSDEIFYVLSGQGRQLLRQADGTDISYDIHPGDTVFLTKNRWHGTSNFLPDEQLDMLLVNCFYEGQSDPHITGVIPRGSVPEESAPYGRRARVLTPQTCGNSQISGEVVTLAPGKKLDGAVEAQEEFFFNLSAGTLHVRLDGGAIPQMLPPRAQAFFFRGDRYCVENPTQSPAQLFRLLAL